MLSRFGPFGGRRSRRIVRHFGPMARPRRLAGQPTLVAVVLGALATLALTEVITLNNRIVVARSEIDRLRGEKAYLEAVIGELEGEWGRLAARDAVVPRAERELGLVAATGPGAVVVVTGPGGPTGDPTWRRVLDAVGSAEAVAPASAQERRP